MKIRIWQLSLFVLLRVLIVAAGIGIAVYFFYPERTLRGEPGPPGTTGETGQTGADRKQGRAGRNGEDGEKGNTGATGAKGTFWGNGK